MGRAPNIREMLKDEGGTALVLVMVILLLMGVLGSMMMSTSTPEMQIARNLKLKEEAFYAAERGVQYGMADASIYTTIGTGSVNIPLTGVSLAVGSTDASGTVRYLSSGPPPKGSGVDITKFKANYYEIKVTGTAPGNARVELETTVVKILPKS